MLRLPLLIGLTLTLVGACGDSDGTPRVPEAGGLVDSARPRELAMERFQRGLTPTDSLRGPASREALVREFVQAVETLDTAAFNRLLITRAEFAWLYYPDAPEGLPPYNLIPEVMWFTQQTRNEKDLSQLLSEAGGKPVGYVRHECVNERLEGTNRIHAGCTLYRTDGGDTIPERWFGLIIERDGAYKFVTYANKVG